MHRRTRGIRLRSAVRSTAAERPRSGAPRVVVSAQVAPDPIGPVIGRAGVVTLAALGVVYGDIGTSPLYALRECFYGTHAVAADARQRARRAVADLLVAASSSSRSSTSSFVMRADNQGEGGILALMALRAAPTIAARRAAACSSRSASSARRCSTATA